MENIQNLSDYKLEVEKKLTKSGLADTFTYLQKKVNLIGDYILMHYVLEIGQELGIKFTNEQVSKVLTNYSNEYKNIGVHAKRSFKEGLPAMVLN